MYQRFQADKNSEASQDISVVHAVVSESSLFGSVELIRTDYIIIQMFIFSCENELASLKITAFYGLYYLLEYEAF